VQTSEKNGGGGAIDTHRLFINLVYQWTDNVEVLDYHWIVSVTVYDKRIVKNPADETQRIIVGFIEIGNIGNLLALRRSDTFDIKPRVETSIVKLATVW